MADNDRKEHYKALQRIKTLTSQINKMQEQSIALTDKEKLITSAFTPNNTTYNQNIHLAGHICSLR